MHHDSIVHVVNRTLHPIDVMYDGRPYVVPPGYKVLEKGGVPVKAEDGETVTVIPAGIEGQPLTLPMLAGAAMAGIKQHPVMGAQDPYLAYADDFKLGVVEESDRFPTTFLDVESEADELINRKLLPADRQTIVHVSQAGRRIHRGPKKRHPVTKRVIGADESSRARFAVAPLNELNENALVGQTRG